MAGIVSYLAADTLNQTPVSALTPLPVTGAGAGGAQAVAAVPVGGTAVQNSSGNVANAIATATLPAAVGKTTYIQGLLITPGGATTGALVTATLVGLGSTLSFTVGAPAGALLAGSPVFVDFGPGGRPSSAVNTAIVLSLPALGTGNTNASVSAWGYQL